MCTKTCNSVRSLDIQIAYEAIRLWPFVKLRYMKAMCISEVLLSFTIMHFIFILHFSAKV